MEIWSRCFGVGILSFGLYLLPPRLFDALVTVDLDAGERLMEITLQLTPG